MIFPRKGNEVVSSFVLGLTSSSGDIVKYLTQLLTDLILTFADSHMQPHTAKPIQTTLPSISADDPMGEWITITLFIFGDEGKG